MPNTAQTREEKPAEYRDNWDATRLAASGCGVSAPTWANPQHARALQNFVRTPQGIGTIRV